MPEADVKPRTIWRSGPLAWLLLTAMAVSIVALFYPGLKNMVQTWYGSEEYGYGFLLPFVTAFLIWQKKNAIRDLPFKGSWTGVVLATLGVGLFFVGKLSALFVIMQYSFLVALAGLVLAVMGWRGFKLVWAPLLILVFMVPLPSFIYNNLSSNLQLLSSEIGVAVIRLFGVPVYLSGNVIDLGTFKLQVAEACSGLRYLFPLLSLSFIAVYFYKAPIWKRATVVLSSIPITVLMNSVRIGVIGVLVDYAGIDQAKGFLHAFEGWAVFMVCLAILIGEMALLSKLGRGETGSFADAFVIDWPASSSEPVTTRTRLMHPAAWTALILLVIGAVGSTSVDRKPEIIPHRADFSEFPLSLGPWKGQPDRLQRIYLDALKLTDYTIANYSRPNGDVVNFYVAYYDSQRAGESAHSPRSCIPGGGWLIKQLGQRTIADVKINGEPLRVNRVLIKKGDYTQVVYYWFQERGRDLTNEYLVKWYLFWDALTKNRTDGALVRLTAFVGAGVTPAQADQELVDFLKRVVPLLPTYIPN